ncbi:MAG: DNA primase [Firmicutes bacterium]|nr:DNA primase [Bacillota bacterium]
MSRIVNNDLNSWIDQLLSRTDIIAVINRYLPLKRKGATHWGNCPFHHEKDPSFSVSADKQLYHCFGCKESGNVITFVSKLENIARWDAIKLLAKEIGLEVPQGAKSGADSEVIAKKKERLATLMRDAAKLYHKNLSLPLGKKAAEYLKKRGITADLITRFGLGVSVGWTQIIEKLEELGYSKDEQKEAGILEYKDGRAYDIYVDRLMFPIVNNYGDVVAFGGRVLDVDAKFAKYRNTSNTLLFDKSRTVYGINLLKKRKREKGLPYIIIAEGYMDVIALHKAGFDMAVASMGTALTLQQSRQLRHYSTNIYISYDGDSAGKGATLRGLDILASCGHNVRVISLPDGMDPDDVLNKFGADYYQKLIDKAPDLTTFKIATLKKEYDTNTEEGKAKFAIEAVKVVKALIDPVEQDRFFGLVSKHSGFAVDVLKKQAEIGAGLESGSSGNAVTVNKDETANKPDSGNTSSQAQKATFFVLTSLAHGQKYADISRDIYPYLTKDWQRAVFEYVRDGIKSGKTRVLSGLFSLPACEGVDDVRRLVEYDFVEGDDAKKFENCLITLEREYYTETKEELVRKYAQTKDTKHLTELSKIEQILIKYKRSIT